TTNAVNAVATPSVMMGAISLGGLFACTGTLFTCSLQSSYASARLPRIDIVIGNHHDANTAKTASAKVPAGGTPTLSTKTTAAIIMMSSTKPIPNKIRGRFWSKQSSIVITIILFLGP